MNSNNACEACAPGTTNDAGDKQARGDDLTATLCGTDERVNSNNVVRLAHREPRDDAGDNAKLGGDNAVQATLCGTDERVNSNNACEACAPGPNDAGDDKPGDKRQRPAAVKRRGSNVCKPCEQGTRLAGDDPDSVDTACTTCAANYFADGIGACQACTGARTNDAGDDKTGTATQCECLVNEYVGSNVCEPCDAGYTRLAGDDPDSVDTACTTCAANYFADGIGACQACTGARTNDAGDDKTGTATQCECW